MVHTLTDPHMITLSYVGEIRITDPVEVTRSGNESDAISMSRFSTLLIERVA